MADAYHHAVSSARKFGGVWEDYYKVHEFMDSSKDHLADARHRVVLHNTFGIAIAQRVFGEVLTRASDGKLVPVRQVVEQHIIEDLGYIPTLERCLEGMQDVLPRRVHRRQRLPLQAWMFKKARPLSRELAETREEIAA